MPNAPSSGSAPSLTEILILSRLCDRLQRRVRRDRRLVPRINKLIGKRDALAGQSLSGQKTETAGQRELGNKVAALTNQINKLLEPFNATRARCLAFVQRLRRDLGILPSSPEFKFIRDDLEKLPLLSRFDRPAFTFSMNQAHLDLRLIHAKLDQLKPLLSHAEEPEGSAPYTHARRIVRPNTQRPIRTRGRPRLTDESQKTLALIISPFLEQNRWMKPSNLKNICKQLDQKKVPGPSGRSWKRMFDRDETHGTRRTIQNIRYRLYDAVNPAFKYLDQ